VYYFIDFLFVSCRITVALSTVSAMHQMATFLCLVEPKARYVTHVFYATNVIIVGICV